MSNRLLPRKVFFTKGVGIAKDPLLSFEYALRDAKIEKFNLVAVSSILPPKIKIVSLEEGLKDLKAGQIVFCVLSRFTSNKKGKEIFSSVGVAIPKNKNVNGYLTEYHGYYKKGIEGHAAKMAKEMLESNLNEECEENFEIFNKAKVKDYTTVISAAILIL
ncbi:MAG: arginine decarboxylase, pyruvoyl-dependent [Candidatus Aenigmatarchaeota archaeon]